MNGDGGGKKLLIIGGAVLLGIAIVNNAYRAGFQDGLVGSGRLRGDELDGWGFFPFPPFPLIVIGGLLFLAYRRGVFGGPRNGHGGNGHRPGRFGQAGGPGAGQPPRFLMEWHRRLHEAERQQAAPAAGRGNGRNGGVVPAGTAATGAESARSTANGETLAAAPTPVDGAKVTRV